MTVDETLQQVFRLAIPEAALVAVACGLFVLSTLKAANRVSAGVLAVGGILLAAYLHYAYPAPDGLVPTVTALLPGGLAAFVRIASLVTGGLLVLSNWSECNDRRAADYHACLLCATAGASLIGAANDLITLFLALELISIPTYVMLYLPRAGEAKAQEAAVKYFMLSVLSSAFTLFGFSYLYGLAGNTNITALGQLLPRVVPGAESSAALIAIVLVVAGLGFRVTAFPFHFYAPDVYQGGPTGTVAFLAFIPKVAGFVALLRLLAPLGEAHPVAPEFVQRVSMLLWILAAVTMTVGNVLGLLQDNLRRMLAYSSVANAGYMLIGLAVVPLQAFRSSADPTAAGGGDALLFYLIAYGAMTVGAFSILGNIDTPDRRYETVDDVAGLHETHPRSAALLAIFLISMIGLPLTAGFAGKFQLFIAAFSVPESAPMTASFRLLAVFGAVNAAVAAYYYLRVLMALYFRSSLVPPARPVQGPWPATALACAVATVAFGVYPWPLISACSKAFAVVRPLAQ